MTAAVIGSGLFQQGIYIMNNEMLQYIQFFGQNKDYLTAVLNKIHENAIDKGFHDLDEFGNSTRNFGESIALIHSELSEALEAHRDGKIEEIRTIGNANDQKKESLGWDLSDDVLNLIKFTTLEPSMVETEGKKECNHVEYRCNPIIMELVDAMIRIADTIGEIKSKDSKLKSLSVSAIIGQYILAKHLENMSRHHKHGKGY